MPISYSLRLLCLLVIGTGVLQVSIELLLWTAAPLILDLLSSLPARRRERALYLLQISTFTLALAISWLCCVPQYLRNESNHAPEAVGWGCLLLTAAFAAWFSLSVARGLRIILRTMRFVRACRRAGHLLQPALGSTPIVTLPNSNHPIALVGLVRPFILISRSLVESRTLAPDALDLVLRHERSHAASRDNWKRLSLHLLPRLNLRLRNRDTWMQLWQRAAEWAADDEAVANDPARSLLLAETLVTLARNIGPQPALIQAAFSSEENELAARVSRLIEQPSTRLTPRAHPLLILSVASLCIAVTLASLASHPPALHHLHEYLLHLG